MSAPIDELLIAVRIEQGSNLMELYEMLRELMGSGGGINIDFPWMVTHQAWSGMITRLENLRDCCAGLHELIPSAIENLRAWIAEAFLDLAHSMTQGIIMAIQAELVGPVEVFRAAITDLSNYIKTDLMNQLTFIIEKIKEGKLTKTDLVGIEKKIVTTKKLIQKYGKVITEIKNIIKDGKYDELIGENKELLNKIITNKEEFEPKVMEFLEKLEETIKSSDDNLGDRLDEDLSLDIPEGRVTQEDLDMAVGVIEEKVGEIYKRVEAIMEDIRYQVGGLARAGEIGVIRQWWLDLDSYVRGKYDEMIRDYAGYWDDVNRVAARLDKISTERTDTRRIIEEYFDKALTKFKPILDKNLKEKMNIEFNTFLDSLSEILDTRLFEKEDFPEEELVEDIREKFPEGTVSTSQDIWDAMTKYEELEKLQEPDSRMKAIEDAMEANRQRREIKETVDDVNVNVESALDMLKPTNDADETLNKDKIQAEKTRERGPV